MDRPADRAVDIGPPLRDIGCFVMVAQHLSFSRAATELGMSQPAVSQAIGRLERTLGLRLFERTSREVQLTDAGKVLLLPAEALLDQVAAFSAEASRVAAFLAEASRLAGPAGQAIRLAYCPLVGGLAARVARRLARRSPGIDLELRTTGWTAATAELVQGTTSAAIMSTPFPAGLATTARFHLPITHLAVPTGSSLGSMSRVRLGQLTRHEVLLPRNRPPGSVWAQLAARLPEPSRSSLPADDLDDLTAALDLVAAGRGLLPVPQLLVQTVLRPDVRFLPLDVGGLHMTYALVWSQDRASAAVMAVVQTVQEILRTPGRAIG